MIVGVPTEVKDSETRVAITPEGCRALVSGGHQVLVQAGAGAATGFADDAYLAAGATIAPDAAAVFAGAEMIVKVKEPQATEWALLRPGQVLFTYLHLAAEPTMTRALLERDVIGIAYETISPDGRSLPLLRPMSEIAGRFAVQAGSRCLEHLSGGRGTLLPGVPGVAPGEVVVVGGGTAGTQAARMAVGYGARVTILEVDPDRVRQLDDLLTGRAAVLLSNPETVGAALQTADLVIGAVLVPGARAPRVISRQQLATMAPGTALVDIAIDQGGCAQTSRPTSHAQPTYLEAGVVHYCVTNMPAAVGRTATLALTRATLPYVLKLAQGWRQAMEDDPALLRGLNICRGRITHTAVAAALGCPYDDPGAALAKTPDMCR